MSDWLWPCVWRCWFWTASRSGVHGVVAAERKSNRSGGGGITTGEHDGDDSGDLGLVLDFGVGVAGGFLKHAALEFEAGLLVLVEVDAAGLTLLSRSAAC